MVSVNDKHDNKDIWPFLSTETETNILHVSECNQH